ncbi:transketolase C-terminal domain-containing protein [Magnetococcus sp. PR-3]|uniref:transketolase C-terminal domain-containing protein n=1 Tax=Magnetococcus sp. PR-3 TaxID=3120355 RepID=UPI002FCE24BB
MSDLKTMRDTLITQVHNQMKTDEKIFFLSADMGSPALDKIRQDFSNRFVNVGIAEQNLIAIAAGLAMEGYTVYTLAIAPFYLRALEQIRNNLSIAAAFRDLNVNMLGVGGGISYDISGPSHHALDDIGAMQTQPNVAIVSPADWQCAQQFPDFAATAPYPKYVRLDGKGHAPIPGLAQQLHWQQGFCEIVPGSHTALITTGFTSQKGHRLIQQLADESIGMIDLFQLGRELDGKALAQCLGKYERWVTLHEGFLGCGSLDTVLDQLKQNHGLQAEVNHLGFPHVHQFVFAPREELHRRNGMGEERVKALLKSR